MYWTLGQFLIALGLALMLALRLASGWALLPATFALLLLLLVLAAIVDGLNQKKPPEQAAAEGTEPPETEVPRAKLPLIEGKPVHLDDLPEYEGRQWRRRVAVLGAYYNERYPREGICTDKDLFLREGDELLLRYHPPADSQETSWRCDFWPLNHGEEARQWFDVGDDECTRIPIRQTGVYSVGVMQGQQDFDSVTEGHVSIWLIVPSPDALSLSLRPAGYWRYHYARTAEGGLLVQSGHDGYLYTQALPVTDYGQPQGGALLFANARDDWDTSEVSEDERHDGKKRFSYTYRWYMQLSRGDVLLLELAWGNDVVDSLPNGIWGSLSFDRFVSGEVLVCSPEPYRQSREFTIDADGFYYLDLYLYGDEWQQRPSTDFVELRLWGLFLQRPKQLRDFDLCKGRVANWGWKKQMLMPVPRDLVAVPDADDISA